MIRSRAAQALAAIGPDAKTAIPELMIAFEDPFTTVQEWVRWALLRIGKPSIKPLIGALKHRAGTVRAAACTALGMFGKDASAAVGPLKSLLADFDPVVARAAQAALDKLKGK